MSFETLKLKLLDRNGRQVAESVQSTIVRAFERAVAIPDVDIGRLELGAARIARVLADGGAAKPEEYAFSVLGHIAWESQREWNKSFDRPSLSDKLTETLESGDSRSSALIADIEVRELLGELDDRDRSIVVMRSRGFRFREIARQLEMLEVSVRCRHHLATRRLRLLAGRKR